MILCCNGWVQLEREAMRKLDETEKHFAALDADRGRDNGGYGDQRPTLRSVLTRRTWLNQEAPWDWLAGLTDGALAAHRAGMWASNQIENLEAAEWELKRREIGVSTEYARALLFGTVES